MVSLGCGAMTFVERVRCHDTARVYELPTSWPIHSGHDVGNPYTCGGVYSFRDPGSMVADAFDLDLAVEYTDVVAGGVDGCWSGEDATVAHAKARAVPGTFYDIPLEGAFVQWTARMGQVAEMANTSLPWRSKTTGTPEAVTR
jgi:hypothetical protein